MAADPQAEIEVSKWVLYFTVLPRIGLDRSAAKCFILK